MANATCRLLWLAKALTPRSLYAERNNAKYNTLEIFETVLPAQLRYDTEEV